MIKRLLILLVLLTQTASAEPLDWAKHHKRFLLLEGAAITGAAIHAAGLHHCRRTNGVEPCDAHYGSAWVNFAAVTSMTVVVMPAVSESCWKDGNGKFCHLFAWPAPAIQAGWGIHEWRINKPDHETK